MVDLFNQLQVASFRGVTFLISNTSTTGGRKSVTHEYPNSDRRYVEDLGEQKEIYSLNGTITGDNYIVDRDNLISALKQEGKGLLVHPFYGSVEVFAKPYSVTESTSSLGVASFEMLFEKVNDSIFPTQSSNNVSIIESRVERVLSQSKTDFLDLYKVANLHTSNYNNVIQKVTSFISKIDISSDTTLKVTNDLNNFNSALSALSRDLTGNVFYPLGLINSIETVVSNFASIGNNATSQFELLSDLFGFGEDDIEIKPTTNIRVERKQNQEAINNYIRTTSLANAFNNIVKMSFDTEKQIDDVNEVLEQEYNDLIVKDFIQDSTRINLKELRVQVRKYLDLARVNTYKISEITTNDIPITILTYNNYGNIDNVNALIELNAFSNPSYINGVVKILS